MVSKQKTGKGNSRRMQQKPKRDQQGRYVSTKTPVAKAPSKNEGK